MPRLGASPRAQPSSPTRTGIAGNWGVVLMDQGIDTIGEHDFSQQAGLRMPLQRCKGIAATETNESVIPRLHGHHAADLTK